jgi:UDPglucose 6-dehydrogenase
MRVAVIGTGYVGLTTGACFAKLGHEVICADIDQAKIDKLRQGEIPIVEAGLGELVADCIINGRLTFVLGAINAVEDCDMVFMCLPTPQGADGEADLSYLLSAAAEISSELAPGTVVVNKSTVPVGSAQKVTDVIGRDDVDIASNPEFLREGTAVNDFFYPDRIVIGSETPEVAQKVAMLYRKIDAPKLLVSTATAELIKYASNAFLAAKISFANSIASLCEAVGANAHEVLEGMGRDSRIGGHFLKPGPGWGGSCFPKDTYALINMAESAGYNFDLLKAVIDANDQQTQSMVDKVAELLGGEVKGATIAAWGLAFKAGTDDTRQSPALSILGRLQNMGANIQAFDPEVKRVEGIKTAPNALAACDGADVLVVLTEWPEFKDVPLDAVAGRMRSRKVLDTRNIIDLTKLNQLWFEYQSIGNHRPYSLVDSL